MKNVEFFTQTCFVFSLFCVVTWLDVRFRRKKKKEETVYLLIKVEDLYFFALWLRVDQGFFNHTLPFSLSSAEQTVG